MTDFRFICVRFILFILDLKILSVTERHRKHGCRVLTLHVKANSAEICGHLTVSSVCCCVSSISISFSANIPVSL